MNVFMTRTMFCPQCNANDRPKVGQYFLFWGATRNHLDIKKIHQTVKIGFTPHIILYQNPIEIEKEGVYIQFTCGVDGCGITITEKTKTSFTFVINKENGLYLPPNDFAALLNWKNTGYELI